MTGGVLIAITVAVIVGGYVFACWFWPFATCKRCKGNGKRRSPTGRAWRTCKRCKGTGRRIRTGRRVFNWLRVLHNEGAR
jgi:hypothetical protein